MARPRSGENGELKIQYQRDKNGNVYAYTNTSYMENGEKRNKRTYLGRVDPETGEVYMEPCKYWHNFIQMPVVSLVFLAGVAGVLYGLGKSVFCPEYRKGIWFAGTGTVLTVLALLLCAGYNNTAYYPSNLDLQSSLTLANSCSSFFTLKVMSVVSILVPFVFAYIFYAWRAIDKKKLTRKELAEEEHAY